MHRWLPEQHLTGRVWPCLDCSFGLQLATSPVPFSGICRLPFAACRCSPVRCSSAAETSLPTQKGDMTGHTAAHFAALPQALARQAGPLLDRVEPALLPRSHSLQTSERCYTRSVGAFESTSHFCWMLCSGLIRSASGVQRHMGLLVSFHDPC